MLLDKQNLQQQEEYIQGEWVVYSLGRSISKSLLNDNDYSYLTDYQNNWINLFGKEFDRLLLLEEC